MITQNTRKQYREIVSREDGFYSLSFTIVTSDLLSRFVKFLQFCGNHNAIRARIFFQKILIEKNKTQMKSLKENNQQSIHERENTKIEFYIWVRAICDSSCIFLSFVLENTRFIIHMYNDFMRLPSKPSYGA